MKKYLGGYANIDLTSETIYNDLLALKDIDKTILLYDPNETKPYFIDTIVYDTNSIVLTKGGKTITIANDNTITSDGDIQKHLYAHFISFDELSYVDSSLQSGNGYIHLPTPIINNNPNKLTLNDILSYLVGYGNDYFQLALQGVDDLEGLKYIESFTIEENAITLEVMINSTKDTLTLTEMSFDYEIKQLL